MQLAVIPTNSEQPTVKPTAGLIVDTRLQKPPSDPLTHVLALAEKARQRQGCDSKPPPQPDAQLPLWPQTVRGVPNALLRTALFTISKDREASKIRSLLASTSDIDLRFTGERFNQTDLDVWEILLHVARTQPLETEVRFSAYSLLKALGKGTGKTQREQLKDGIARLQGGVVEITWKKDRKTFSGQLVGNAFRDDMTQEYVVVLNEKLLSLYAKGHTYIDWTQRQTLKSSLSKWLHGFFSTHDKPYPYKVAKVRALCGSTTKELWKFRQMLRVALDDLVMVGFLKKWDITPADLVSVVVVPSDRQVKHALKTDLTTWLRGVYSGQAIANPYKVEALRNLYGSKEDPRKFRQILKNALRDLATVGYIKDWDITPADLVHVNKKHVK